MNLQHLRYFSLACKYHNISRAAEEYHMSQSSISSAIKALEEEFNTTLIKRQRTEARRVYHARILRYGNKCARKTADVT